MEVLRNNDIPAEEWNTFLAGSFCASPFQSHSFFDFYNSVPGYSAEATALYDGGQIVALVVATFQQEKGIKGLFSRRAIVYGGPVINQSPEILEYLLKQNLFSFGRTPIYAETRNSWDYSDYSSVYLNQGWEYLPYLNFILDCSGKTMGDMMAQMSYNRKREIKLSINEGASVSECISEGELRELYLILSELYMKQVKLPIPSFDFFRIFREKEIGPVFIVRHDDRIIGGSICPCLSKRSINTWYYCGIRHYDKKIFPTHLAVLGAIEYAVKNNIPRLDFMGAGQPSKYYGVREYKKEFGGSRVEYGRFLKVLQPGFYSLGKFGLSLMKQFG
jgi:serine/alanine adding enzyme